MNNMYFAWLNFSCFRGEAYSDAPKVQGTHILLPLPPTIKSIAVGYFKFSGCELISIKHNEPLGISELNHSDFLYSLAFLSASIYIKNQENKFFLCQKFPFHELKIKLFSKTIVLIIYKYEFILIQWYCGRLRLVTHLNGTDTMPRKKF